MGWSNNNQGTGMIGTAWAADTVDGTWVANTTYTCLSRRVGDTLECQVRIDLTGAPTATNLALNVPGGRTVDEAKLFTSGNRPIVGTGMVIDTGTASRVNVDVAWDYTNNQIYPFVCTTQPNTGTQPTATSPQTFANTDSIILHFFLPISGWSAT